ncbi:uncharacterized protein LOC108095227 [Drosophila ficusphila]|uniref:uncharacterized protein LOC108095227 n=1 Tax=Drosophila ficusphila TaxID=30025 RepID=UPI0007E729E7|nr:uncharacterized protein LOC108095227 [Drosophila ficusphila]
MANQSKAVWMLSAKGYHLKCNVDPYKPLVNQLKNQYSEAFGVSPGSLILRFDGEEMEEQDTFDSLDMVEHDIIDVLEFTWN